MKGKLIVLEGIDGSGKSEQLRRICARLEGDRIKYKQISFPRYDEESSALIKMYLAGKFGASPKDVNAYTASLFYAVDRYASFKSDWEEIYNAGEIIISDRYTTSNIVHQGSKLNEDELINFFDWLYDLEHNKLCLPKPDLVLYLDVDIETALSRMKLRQVQTNTQADIHEKDVSYLENCLKTAEEAAAYYRWKRIPFQLNEVERDIQEKNDEIYQAILTSLLL